MLRETVARFLREEGLWGPGHRLLVAVSGGVDSVVLLRILASLRAEGGFVLAAAHLHHGLRAEADRDAAFVEALCRALAVPCTLGRTEVRHWADGRSAEMAARDLRWDFLKKTRDAWGGEIILTAHHADDQLETMLLRLAHGTSLTGLSAIHPHTADAARPLLTVPRAEIEAYARREGFSWVEDATNGDPAMERNRLRLEAVPVLKALNPRAAEAAARLAELLRQDEDYITAQAAPTLARIAPIPGGAQWTVEALPEALLGRVLVKLMDRAGMTEIRRRDIGTLTALCRDGGAAELPQGYRAVRWGGRLQVFRPENGPLPERPLALPGVTQLPHGRMTAVFCPERGTDTPFCQHFDADAFPPEVLVRGRRKGDTVAPLGMQGHITLKKAMIQRHVPNQARDGWPLLAVGDRVLWVPGACLMDRELACGEGTCRWLQVKYEGEEQNYGSFL